MVNKVTLIGNLGGDPEIRHLESGVMVGRFSLATNESYKDKNGDRQDLTEWHNVVVWRELADIAGKYLKKGMRIYVEGKISYRKYTDKDGVDKYSTDIVANSFKMLEKRDSDYSSSSRFPESETPGANSKPAAVKTEVVSDNGGNDVPPEEGDGLPF